MQSMPESDEERIRLHAQLLNAVEQAVLAVDLTGRIIFWNRFAERLYGWSEDEAQGRNITELLAAPLLMEAARANMGQLRRGESWSGEFLLQRRDGTAFVAHVSAALVQDDQSTLISIVAVSRDSTAQQQLQEANRLLAEASARLANAVDYETQTDHAGTDWPCRSWLTGAPCICCKPMAQSSRWRWPPPRRLNKKKPATGCKTTCPMTTWTDCRRCCALVSRNWSRK